MKRRCSAVGLLLLCASSAVAQPTDCSNESHCNDGYYCDRTHTCRECLQCEDFKRKPLPISDQCRTTVAECGDCLSGLVEDPSGDVNAECVLAGSAGLAAGGQPAPYLWAALATGLLLLLLVTGVAIYVLKYTDSLKILTSTRASLQPGAPPPPYPAQPPYAPVRPTSPPLHATSDEVSYPLVKGVPGAGCESELSQAARPYNYPSYVRGPELPPSYDSTLSDEEAGPNLHDEDTMESTWTPADDNIAIAAPPPPPSEEGPSPSKVICVRQDGNNNAGSLSFNITVQQHNDVKLISA